MSIKIRLTDTNHKVKPENVKLKDLTKLLSETESMLLSQIEHNGHDKSEITIALTNIENESVSVVLADNKRAENALSVIAHAITTGDYHEISHRGMESLRNYVGIARKLTCDIELKLQNTVCAKITKDTVIPENATVTEQNSVLYGKVITVGNRKLRVKLELLNGELFSFDVGVEQARQLGKRLFDDVMLYGDKVIDLVTLEVVGFKMTSIDNNFGDDRDMPVKDWVELVRSEIDFSYLDKVGAEAYLKEARGEK